MKNFQIHFRKYMRQQISMDESSSGDVSRDSSPEAETRDPKGGSFSSLMNILTSMKKSSMKKNALESRKRLDGISKQDFRSQSEIDLSAVPGSCSNIKTHFESSNNNNNGNFESQADRDDIKVTYKILIFNISASFTFVSFS